MIDPISSALIAAAMAIEMGGLTEENETEVVDISDALKDVIRTQFGSQHELVKAVEAVEAKPTSNGRRATLAEEVVASGANQNDELLALAAQLRQFLKDHAKTNAVVQQIITGNYNATSVYGDASVTMQVPKEA